jgi:hypothetical protein
LFFGYDISFFFLTIIPASFIPAPKFRNIYFLTFIVKDINF